VRAFVLFFSGYRPTGLRIFPLARASNLSVCCGLRYYIAHIFDLLRWIPLWFHKPVPSSFLPIRYSPSLTIMRLSMPGLLPWRDVVTCALRSSTLRRACTLSLPLLLSLSPSL